LGEKRHRKYRAVRFWNSKERCAITSGRVGDHKAKGNWAELEASEWTGFQTEIGSGDRRPTRKSRNHDQESERRRRPDGKTKKQKGSKAWCAGCAAEKVSESIDKDTGKPGGGVKPPLRGKTRKTKER